MNGKYVTAVVKFTSIELLVNITCKIYNQSLYTALRKREGFGGEKAATGAASLPVPNNFNISLNLRKLSRLRLSTVPYAAPAPCRSWSSGESAGRSDRSEIFRQRLSRCGFTLIELLVVIAIIAIVVTSKAGFFLQFSAIFAFKAL